MKNDFHVVEGGHFARSSFLKIDSRFVIFLDQVPLVYEDYHAFLVTLDEMEYVQVLRFHSRVASISSMHTSLSSIARTERITE